MTDVEHECPSCGARILIYTRFIEGVCDSCKQPWHLFIETKATLRAGTLQKTTDRKDTNTKPKAFVAPEHSG